VTFKIISAAAAMKSRYYGVIFTDSQ